MNTYKISFNPDSKDYISGYGSHSIGLYNKGKQKLFDNYIRGIIDKGTLYLRVYYPYNDINTLTRDKLYQYSYELLQGNISGIIGAIKKHDSINIKDIKYNVDRQYLEGVGLYNT